MPRNITDIDETYDWTEEPAHDPEMERFESELEKWKEKKQRQEWMKPTREDKYALECLRNIEAGLPFDGHPDTWDDR